MRNRAWRRIESERGSVFLEYALIASLLTTVAIVAFTPASGGLWAGSNFGNDFLIRDALLNLPFF